MLKMKALPLRLVHALDACAEAKVRNVAPEWRLRKAQREMNRCRRLIQASHKSAVKKIQIGQPQKSARSCLKQEDLISAEAEIAIVDDRTITLALSESRAYDSALEIRGAYKLTGNFHVNVEIVLEHLGAFDDVTFEIEPKSWLTRCPDRRHVGFRPNDTVQKDRFNEILRPIKAGSGSFRNSPGGRDRFTGSRSSGCIERRCLNWKLDLFTRSPQITETFVLGRDCLAAESGTIRVARRAVSGSDPT